VAGPDNGKQIQVIKQTCGHCCCC